MSDELYMQRALDLALLGHGSVSPNPMVGCVVVHNGRIIGEGWHQQYGGPHAEVNAINAVEDKSLLPESRVYVTLEPCSHYGKTPPCADLLISFGVKDIVICNTDPNPLVAGRGIKKLLDAGAQVKVGILEQEGLILNKRFFTFHSKQRPYIFLKWAETADGYIAADHYQPVQISGPLAKRLVHKWRAEEQAIMIGTRTALHDNPKLNTRFWKGNNPIRLVIDRQLVLPDNLHLYDRSQTTVIYNFKRQAEEDNLHLVKLDQNTPLLPQIWKDLHSRNVLSVLIEGGTFLHESLIREGYWDEAFIFKSLQKKLGGGIKAPLLTTGILKSAQTLGTDTLLHYNN